MKLIDSQDVINLIEKSPINGWVKDALINDIKALPDLGNCKNCKIMEYVFMQVTDATLQSTQPEIIRCKDCKHYDGRPCGIVDWYNTADDFCSKAERRTNA